MDRTMRTAYRAIIPDYTGKILLGRCFRRIMPINLKDTISPMVEHLTIGIPHISQSTEKEISIMSLSNSSSDEKEITIFAFLLHTDFGYFDHPSARQTFIVSQEDKAKMENW